MDLTIRFKQGPLGVDPDQWPHLHPTCHRAAEVLSLALNSLGYDSEITDMIRPKGKDSGIHATGRALDMVPRQRANCRHKMDLAQHKKMAGFINFAFRRRNGLLTCVFHDVGSGYHYHIQTDPTPGWVDLNGSIPVEVPATSPLPPEPSVPS